MLTAETVGSILHFEGDGLPVTSLYARVEPGAGHRELHSRVSSLLDVIRPAAKDETVEHESRLSLRDDIARIRDALGDEQWRPGAMAIFACSGHGLYQEVPLPMPVRDRVVVDTIPFSRPMLAVLEEYDRSCVAVVDEASARLFELYQDELHDLGEIADPKLRRADYATWPSEYRMHNKADELRKRHYRHVAGQLSELLATGGYDLLIVGGHDYEVPDFVEQLPRDLRARIAGTFAIDPSAMPLAELRSSATAIVDRFELGRDQQLVAEALERAATGGLAALGLPDCLWAGTAHAIQTLLVQDGASVPGVVCDESGWLALSGQTCPLCGRTTRSTPDVLDELVQAVVDDSGSVRHIRAETRLSDVETAAELRFPLPPRPG
jgi:Bacterial archaeo-eukaryotic release factor family 10